MIYLIILIAIAAVWLLLGRNGRKKEGARLRIHPPEDASAVDASPDVPVPFGYKSQWYAVRSTDTQAVAEAFDLREALPCNWNSGLRRASDFTGVFVTPPLRGWILVVGWSLPDLSSPQGEPYSVTSLLQRLSRDFGEAHYYATHRVVEYHAWAQATGGELVRGYAYAGESEETVLDIGERTAEERELGLSYGSSLEEGEEDDDVRMRPTEEDVVRLAGLWSVNPLAPPEPEKADTGWTGQLPAG
ncbi:hypothetical protein [Paenibacillus sp. KR2-11]|uniref:hypothetical protein n=1 Tax=Paenibacillus sp. KR2-11 TaxID=3385500 RepID=UPI0038FC9326|nr:hypothetical protein [Paenibacillus caseinilyticus]